MLDDLMRLSVNEDGIFIFIETGRIIILLNKQEEKSIKSACLDISRTIFLHCHVTRLQKKICKGGLDRRTERTVLTADIVFSLVHMRCISFPQNKKKHVS